MCYMAMGYLQKTDPDTYHLVRMELQRQREEAERQHRIEEARRLQAMFDHLISTMKLHGLPDLHFKLAGTGGEMQFKLGDQSQGYGISGLPGIYTGGPRDGRAQGTQGSTQPGYEELKFKLGDSDATNTAANAPNASGPGIQGLPGIHLSGNGDSPATNGTGTSTSHQPAAPPDFSKMTPEQSEQMAKMVSSLPAAQQEKILAAAQGPAPANKAALDNSPTTQGKTESAIGDAKSQNIAAIVAGIGQQRPVTIYRLVTKGTIEEKIWELQQRKAALARDILGEGGFARALTRDDLNYLLAEV